MSCLKPTNYIMDSRPLNTYTHLHTHLQLNIVRQGTTFHTFDYGLLLVRTNRKCGGQHITAQSGSSATSDVGGGGSSSSTKCVYLGGSVSLL